MPPFTRDEVYELNEWIRTKQGTYDEWMRQRAADRDISEEAYGLNQTDPGVQRTGDE